MEENVIETVAEVGNGNLIKTAAIVLGVGLVVGAAFGIKKLIERRKVIQLGAPEHESVPENPEK